MKAARVWGQVMLYSFRCRAVATAFHVTGVFLVLGCAMLADSQFQAVAQLKFPPPVAALLTDPENCWKVQRIEELIINGKPLTSELGTRTGKQELSSFNFLAEAGRLGTPVLTTRGNVPVIEIPATKAEGGNQRYVLTRVDCPLPPPTLFIPSPIHLVKKKNGSANSSTSMATPAPGMTGPDIQIGLAGGVANISGNGTLGFHDVISGETAVTGRSFSVARATYGFLGSASISTHNFLLQNDRIFFETGVILELGDGASWTFTDFSPNIATGTTKVTRNWSVPIIGGVSTPLTDFGVALPNVSLQIGGGGMIDNRTEKINFFEVLPDLQTSNSDTKTQLNPAAMVGFQYHDPASPWTFGLQTIFDFQQPINFTTQSTPFPSAFYTVNTGHQVDTTVVASVTVTLNGFFQGIRESFGQSGH